MKRLIHKIKILIPMLVFFVLYMFAFGVLEKYQALNYHYMFADIDRMIPFCEVFVVPYFLCFLFIPAVVVYLLFAEENEYRYTSMMLIIGMSAFIIISAVFPTKLQLRPVIMPRENIFSDMVKMLYSIDTSTNVFPSIHVYNTVVVLWAVFKSRTRLFGKTVVRVSAAVLSTLIVLATMFLKQHSVIDVAGAFLLFGVVRTAVVAFYRQRRLVPTFGERRS